MAKPRMDPSLLGSWLQHISRGAAAAGGQMLSGRRNACRTEGGCAVAFAGGLVRRCMDNVRAACSFRDCTTVTFRPEPSLTHFVHPMLSQLAISDSSPMCACVASPPISEPCGLRPRNLNLMLRQPLLMPLSPTTTAAQSFGSRHRRTRPLP